MIILTLIVVWLSLAFSEEKKFVAGNFVSSWLGHGVIVINWLFCFLCTSSFILVWLVFHDTAHHSFSRSRVKGNTVLTFFFYHKSYYHVFMHEKNYSSPFIPQPKMLFMVFNIQHTCFTLFFFFQLLCLISCKCSHTFIILIFLFPPS